MLTWQWCEHVCAGVSALETRQCWIYVNIGDMSAAFGHISVGEPLVFGHVSVGDMSMLVTCQSLGNVSGDVAMA